MILLNLVRMIITLIGLIVLDAFRVAYGLDGWQLMLGLALTLFGVFFLTDLAEDALVAHFNPEEKVGG